MKTVIVLGSGNSGAVQYMTTYYLEKISTVHFQEKNSELLTTQMEFTNYIILCTKTLV